MGGGVGGMGPNRRKDDPASVLDHTINETLLLRMEL